MFRTSILAAALVAVVSPAPASAQEASARIRYSDLNLSSDAGRARLDRRVRVAAEAMCKARPTGMLAIDAKTRRCMDAAIAQAQPAVMAAVRNAGTAVAAR
jgi:UrcA family protein